MQKILLILIIFWVVIVGWIIYFNYQLNYQKFQVIFFNIGQGDSALVKLSNGEKMLVDCGPDKNVLSKLGKFLSFYDRTIDYLVVSHFDLDHYGGCVDVLKRYKVRNIITNGSSKDDSYWQSWDKFRKLEQANEFVVMSSSSWSIGDDKINFLWPVGLKSEAISFNDENNKSIVLRISNSSTSILFTGDLRIEGEKVLIDLYCNSVELLTGEQHFFKERKYVNCPRLDSKILKAGHHGSDTSSSDEFLQVVNPQTAIISVGKNNFGHPSLRVLRKMERQEIDISQTQYNGDIVMGLSSK